jgi:hypothetical protein
LKDPFLTLVVRKGSFNAFGPGLWSLCPEGGTFETPDAQGSGSRSTRADRQATCRERRVDGIGDAVKGALTALNAVKAPFTAPGML